MKKNVIALLLAVVMVSSSVGSVPVLAAETVEQEEVAEEEETVEDAADTEDAELNETSEGESAEVIEEESEQGATDAIEEDETIEETDAAEAEEEVDSAETADTSAETAAVAEPAEDVEEESIEIEDKEAAPDEAGDAVNSGTCGANATWTLTGNGSERTLTISGSGEMDNYSYNGDNVSPWNSDSTIAKVIIENGITSIGDRAFYRNTSLQEIIIPNSVTSIGAGSLDGCTSLKSIDLPNSITTIGDAAFENSGIEIFTVPPKVTVISDSLFYGSSIKKINIHYGVTSIGRNAFYWSSLESINLPNTVVAIGESAFSWSHVQSIKFPEHLETIENGMFLRCGTLNSIVIPESVNRIKDSAFYDCSNLTDIKYTGSKEKWNSIEIVQNGNDVLFRTNIQYEYQYHCDNHVWDEEYTIDEEATCTDEGSESIHCSICGEIDESTIRVIPRKDHEYGDWTVTKEATCVEAGSKEKICANCGDKVTEEILATGHIWNEEYTVDKEATYEEEGSESIHCSVCGVIDESTVRSIPKKEPGADVGICGENATWRLTGTEPNLTLTISGSGAVFSYNSAEVSSIPWALKSTNIKSVVIEDGITAIGDYSFYSLSNLTEVRLPDTISSIGNHAFSDCTGIEELSIPESVLNIGENAFLGCESLEKIYYSGSEENWQRINHSVLPDNTEVIFGQITEIPVNEITLDKTAVTLEVSSQEQLTVELDPVEATNKTVTWTSSDEHVAVVDDMGKITAVATGTASIVATSANGKTATCVVEVIPIHYSIEYVLNGGTNASENPAKYCENDQIVFSNPSRAGYTFGGWYSDEELTERVTGIDVGRTGDLTFYAKWIPKTYKIVFNGNTANSGKMPGITYTIDETGPLPANAFTKKEYAFVGWNTTANGKGISIKNKGSLDGIDAENGSTITLYAQWKIKEYQIIYKLNGGTNNKTNPSSYNFKSTISTLAKPTKKGFVFQGWFTDAKCTKKFAGIKKGSTGTRTVYAKWKIVKYTVQYVLNGGKAPAGNPASYYVTSANIQLKNPARKGYTFCGWYLNKQYKTKITAIPKGSTGNLRLFAKWKLTDFQIMYQLNGGINNKKNPATYKMTSNTIKLNNPSKKGYKFAGWYCDAKFTKKFVSILKGSIGKKTVYAKWIKQTYTIKYELDGGSVDSPNPEKYSVTTETFVITEPHKKGYVFEGWYSDSGFQNRIEEIKKGSTGNLTLYAKWKVITYSISYIIDDGVNSEDNPETYTVETAITLNEPVMEPEREGFVFRGWYSDPECTNRVTQIKKGTIGDKTFYAKWSYIGFSQFPDKVLIGENNIKIDIDADAGYSFRSSDTSILRLDNRTNSIVLSPENPGIAKIELIKNNGIVDSINIRVMDYSNAKVVANTFYITKSYKEVYVTMNIPSTLSLYVGDERRLKSVTIIKGGRTVEYINCDSLSFESSDSSIVETAGFSNDKFTAVRSGKCTVKLIGKYNLAAELTLNVKDKVKTPYIVEQGKVTSGGYHSIAYCDSVRLDYGGFSDDDLQEIEVYRSTSKYSGYKKVDVGYYDDGLKPNTRYFYKARIKLRKQNVFGPFSKPVAYWTAPKGHYDWFEKPEKIKYNESTHMISWAKINGASGYIVAPYYSWFRGYNIFGQEVYTTTIELKTTKNTSMKAWKCASTSHWPSSIKAVVPYAVHNGYVYAEGYRITSNVSKLKNEVNLNYQ